MEPVSVALDASARLQFPVEEEITSKKQRNHPPEQGRQRGRGEATLDCGLVLPLLV